MRLILYTIAAIFLGFSPASAQFYSITATGTITGTSPRGTLSNVPVGANFTFNFSFDEAAILTPLIFPGGYATPSGTATLSIDGSTYTDNVGTGVVMFSEDTGGPFGPAYGYFIGGTSSLFSSVPHGTPDPIDLEIDLASTNPAVAPNTSLSSLQTSPISDFYWHGLTFTLPDSALFGNVTDFSVTVSAAPEPSISSLVIIFLVVLGCLHHLNKSRSSWPSWSSFSRTPKNAPHWMIL